MGLPGRVGFQTYSVEFGADDHSVFWLV